MSRYEPQWDCLVSRGVYMDNSVSLVHENGEYFIIDFDAYDPFIITEYTNREWVTESEPESEVISRGLVTW